MTANKEKPEILYLITARGGSTRLPGKNLMKIGDHSLIAYKAISAGKSKYCSRLVISTDSPEMQAEGIKYGAEAPFLRPDHLANVTAASDDVVMHALNYFEKEEGLRYDAVMMLEPTSPFAKGDDFDAGVEMFIEKKASLVVGMRKTDVNTIFIGQLEPDGNAKDIIGKFAHRDDIRGQSFEPQYTLNGAFYLMSADQMRKTGRIYRDPENSYGYLMDTFHSVEIDNLHDFRLAELYAQSGDVDLSYWQ